MCVLDLIEFHNDSQIKEVTKAMVIMVQALYIYLERIQLVYEVRNTSNDSRGQPQMISPVLYVKLTPDNRQRTDSNLQERELENPIYGEAEESGENNSMLF